MHYQPNVDLAFISVEHIIRDVWYGWIIRYIHANVASFFFIFVYMHIGRGLYYGSYKSPRTLPWSIGVVILVLIIATAFMGYDHSPKWIDNKPSSTTDNVSTNPILRRISFIISTCRRSPWFKGLSFITSRSTPTYSSFARILTKHNLQPVFTWENLQDIEVKKEMQRTVKCRSLPCLDLATGHCYVGSGRNSNMSTRLDNYLWALTGGKPLALERPYDSLDHWGVAILDVTTVDVTHSNNAEFLRLELYFIDPIKPMYQGLAQNVGNPLGYKHTPETLQAIKDNYSDKGRKKIGSLNKGKNISEETKELIRQSALARPPISETTRALFSEKKKVSLLVQC